MIRAPWVRALACAVLLAIPAAAQHGDLFENVVDTLADHYFDRQFREQRLPGLAARYRPHAHAAANLAAERGVVHAMLAEIPTSHLALYSVETCNALHAELFGLRRPTLGLELEEDGDGEWVSTVLEGGPAAVAGVRRGDRVLTIDGVPADDSPRLDWRSDDAHLPDPAVHELLCEDGDRVVLRIASRPGSEREVVIVAARDSALLAAARSAHVETVDGHRIGVVHIHFMHFLGVAALVHKLRQGAFADSEALVLDMRGRGGSPQAVVALLAELRRWKRPIVALIDRQTRSAKEMFAYELHRSHLGLLVGERTAGALMPASFESVGHDSVLMFPATKMPRYSDPIEGKGVAPDVAAPAPGPYSAGEDPILTAGLRVAVQRIEAPKAAVVW